MPDASQNSPPQVKRLAIQPNRDGKPFRTLLKPEVLSPLLVLYALESNGNAMTPTKSLQQREKELQSMLADPAGRKKLQELESQYHAASGTPKPAKTSVITYILVYEREHGLIQGDQADRFSGRCLLNAPPDTPGTLLTAFESLKGKLPSERGGRSKSCRLVASNVFVTSLPFPLRQT